MLNINEYILCSNEVSQDKYYLCNYSGMEYKRFKTFTSVKSFDSKIKVIKDILLKDFSDNIIKQCDIYFIDDNPNVIFDTLINLKSDNILYNKNY